MPGEGVVHTRFSVKFYVTALLFMLFDLEIVILVPWVVRLPRVPPPAHPHPGPDPVLHLRPRARPGLRDQEGRARVGALTPPDPAMRLDKIIARSRIIDLRSLDARGRAGRAPRRLHRQVPRPEAGVDPQGPARPREHDDDLPRPRGRPSARPGEDVQALHPGDRPQPGRHAPPRGDVGRAGAPDHHADRGRVGARHPPGARVDRPARARAASSWTASSTRPTWTRSTSGSSADSAG